eukprot:TRINITY_DN10932_c0_g1_i1.p1 TRINITY_DN10932_c0_g1~~TRINITY_DN10932_c0_g1_i1.p1  ORF type:complete len:236 (-),score=43.29 TRINITY_DN10932_c0_g1_i1:187-894(-)
MASRWGSQLAKLVWKRSVGNLASCPEKVVPLKFVCFDMDGTLTLLNIDFKEMRRRMGIAPHEDIIGCLESRSVEERARLNAIIEEVELEARRGTRLQPGLCDVLTWLHSTAKLETGIITRNSDDAIQHFFGILNIPGAGSSGGLLSKTLSRTFVPCKPSPAPLLHLCQEFGIEPESTLMIGDSIDDILCGRQAGAATCVILNSANRNLIQEADFSIEGLEELPEILTKDKIILQR